MVSIAETHVGDRAASLGQNALDGGEVVPRRVARGDTRVGEPGVGRVLDLSADDRLNKVDDGGFGVVGVLEAVAVVCVVVPDVVRGEASLRAREMSSGQGEEEGHKSRRKYSSAQLTACLLNSALVSSYLQERPPRDPPCCQKVQLGLPWDFQNLLMYASRSYLAYLFRSGVMMSPPFHGGTTVPLARPVVVLGDGTGSYLHVSDCLTFIHVRAVLTAWQGRSTGRSCHRSGPARDRGWSKSSSGGPTRSSPDRCTVSVP